MTKHILIMAAGTGGHVFPGLVVAKMLKNEGIQVSWLGTSQGREAKWVLAENIPFFPITMKGLRGKGLFEWLIMPFKLIRAIAQAKRIISTVKPNIVLAMGGFVSAPGGIAARLLKIPLIIHEQNAIPGLTNQLLANFFTRGKSQDIKVLTAFPNSFPKKIHAIQTGNPVREELLHLPPPEKRWGNRSGRLNLLILGGSLGAQSINQILPKAIALMPPSERPTIYHQTGDAHLEATKALYAKQAPFPPEHNKTGDELNENVVSFIHDMAKAYSWADLVICRAGAITLTELCSVGIGSILIPFPYAVDDHQTKNAEYLSKAGSAILLPQSELTPEKLAEYLISFSINRSKLVEMAKSAYSLRMTDATKKVIDHCKKYL